MPTFTSMAGRLRGFTARGIFLDGLPEGKVTIMVTLNSNRHEDLFHDGKQIQATVELD